MSRHRNHRTPQHHPECAECVRELQALNRIREVDEKIEQDLETVIKILARQPETAVITQGAKMPLTGTIKGLAPGASDTFFVTPTNQGNADALPAGSPIPTITADDATVVVTTAPDGLSATVAAAATATVGGSFNLNWAASYTDLTGAVKNITATANVPYIAAPALLPDGGVISQGAPAV